jgi:hypothetical protein
MTESSGFFILVIARAPVPILRLPTWKSHRRSSELHIGIGGSLEIPLPSSKPQGRIVKMRSPLGIWTNALSIHAIVLVGLQIRSQVTETRCSMFILFSNTEYGLRLFTGLGLVLISSLARSGNTNCQHLSGRFKNVDTYKRRSFRPENCPQIYIFLENCKHTSIITAILWPAEDREDRIPVLEVNWFRLLMRGGRPDSHIQHHDTASESDGNSRSTKKTDLLASCW